MSLALDPAAGVEVASDAVARAVKSGADDAKAIHTYGQRFEVNFDTHDVTLVRTTVTDNLSITAYVGTRKGSADLTGRSHDAVDKAAAQAVNSARAGEPDPANVLPVEPASPAVSAGHDEPDREAMVDAVIAHIHQVEAEYPAIRTDSSIYAFDCKWTSYANSAGRIQSARRGTYSAQFVVTARDGQKATSFNYTAQAAAEPFANLTDLPATRLLLEETVGSFDARPVPETFVGDVIFTPAGLSTLVSTVVGSLKGLALIRKTSPFLDCLDSAIAAPGFTVAHRPSVLAGAAPFDGEGFANTDVDIIRDGVLQNFVVDWYAGQKLGRPMTTGSVDLVVEPGDAPLADVIAATERGIVLGRFSGGMPSANLDFSGVAKNSYYVENGRIVHPIAETMIAGNFRSVLESITAISAESIDFGTSRLPWLAAAGVTVSTK